MTRIVLGFDTSCYTTSAAAVTEDGQLIASARKLLPVKLGERGLRQSEGLFVHIKQMPGRMEELSAAIRGMEIAAVCASARPRDEESSYMPVFLCGLGHARSIASALGVPCYISTHQRGHIAAAALESGIREGDLLALHLSGGTTELLSLKGEELTLLGGTLDLHAGQLVDRVGVAMGLPFPAGPHLEELAAKGASKALLPVSMDKDGISCHLSGQESQLQRMLATGSMAREDLAREVYDLLARTVSRMVCAGAEQTGIRQALLAGGVASSPLFRSLVTERIHKKDRTLAVCFGRPSLSGDNAVGAALIGAKKLRMGEPGHIWEEE